METMNQRRVSAADTGVQRPAGVPTSAFDLAKQAAKTARPRTPRLDPAAVVVRQGVPIPENPRGAGSASPYKALLDKMGSGDSVQLIETHAKSLVAYAKKMGVKVALRKLGDGLAGVWRV